LTLTLATAGVAGLLVAKTGGRVRRRLAAAAPAVAVAAMLVAPAAWAASTLDSRYAGTVLDAYAGPTTDSGGGAQFARRPATLTVDQQRILDYATAHRDGARYLFATDSWNAASPYIVATGAPILPMGGFSGQAPFPTLAQFQQLVSTGQVRQVLLSGGFDIFRLFRGAEAAPPDTPVMAITGWVRQHCTTVLAASETPAGPPTMGTGTLYSCPSGV